jgi:asparagine synthase (glutamine-hydrolysing)
MCGIGGVISWDPLRPRREVVGTMLALMRHRGPDHQAQRRVGRADLGSCRLAIQDLTPAGHQPMLNETGTVGVVFNGEIYNAAGLRRLLCSAGHHFRGHSDTEVLVHGYEEWGLTGLLDRCEGMWAFALWDEPRGTAILSRDRCGEKPLYFTFDDGELAFASTTRALLQGRGSKPAYRRDVILEYLACGYVPPDRCVFEGMHKLPPATYLTATSDGTWSLRRYWDLPYAEDDRDMAILEHELEEVLEAAVAQCLVSDVPVGAFLSGGIDSSLVVALMARHRRRIRTFTMRVPGTERDEGVYARAVAERYHTEHVEVRLGSECVEALPEIVELIGEPFGDASAVPAFFVSREIRKYATVVLGGDGGDEAFGGYRGVPYLNQLERFHRLGGAGLRRAAPKLLEWADGGRDVLSRAVRAAAYSSDFAIYLRNLCLPGPAQASRLVGPALEGAPFSAWCRPFTPPADVTVPARWFQRGLAAGISATLAGDYLVKIDSATMGHSVEARSPFLARRVLEFAATLPAHAIADRQHDKVLLRRLARRLVPHQCIDRSKAGFSVPVERWLEGAWRPLVDQLLHDSVAAREGLISATGLSRLVRGEAPFVYRRGAMLFVVLMLELWLRLVVFRSESVEAVRAAIGSERVHR